MQNLERRLGLFSVILISIGAMLGSGVFVLPGLGFATTGASIWLAYLVAAISIIPAALSKAELATAMPSSGGTYIYLERTFGPWAGTMAGLGLFFSILFKSSFALIGIGVYFSILSDYDPRYVILGLLVFITTINLMGVSKVSGLITFILIISIASLVGLSAFSFPTFDADNLSPMLPNGEMGFLMAIGLVYVSFAGVTKIAAIAEEIKSPEKTLPKSIIASLIIVTVIYCLVSLMLAGNFSFVDLSGDLKPVYRLAKEVGGTFVGKFIAVVAILTMLSEANAGILAGSRFPFAMSRDKLLPSFLGKLHRKTLTPMYSIILSGIIIGIAITSLPVAKLAKFASAYKVIIFMLVNFTVIVLRESRTQWYKPVYKSPLYPGLQIFGILSSLAFLVALGQISLIAIGSVGLLGTLLYVFYSRTKTTRRGVVGIRGKRLDLVNQEEAPETNLPNIYSFDSGRSAQVVVNLFGKERSPEMLIEMGLAMAENRDLEVAHIQEIPEQTTLHDVLEEPAELRSLRRRVIAMAIEKKAPITFDPVASHDVSRTIFEISQRLHCQWLLIEWRGRSRGALTFHNPIGWLKSHLHCNLAIFRDTGVRYIRKIMVLINADKNDALVLETADHLAEVNKADITLMKYSDVKVSKEKQNYENSFLIELGNTLKAPNNTKIVVGKDEIKALVAETVEYDLLILGSQDHSVLTVFTGAFDDKMIAKSACSVLAVHTSSF